MRNFIKNLVAYYLSLFIISNYLVPSLIIQNGLLGYTKSVLVLAIINPILKPLLKLIFFPLNLLTLGFFSLIIELILVYFLSLLVPEFKIQPVGLNRFWVIILITLLLFALRKLIIWLLR